ncbi:HAD-IA family hydrolase [Paenibacillus xylanilyticus]|uniref:HAD-IA family hydrolase n=1 Tax=Paenibacillus xylanilyticus TaxID=248903 RepID=A0A7Y6EWQ3_9BACL|nr:HAD-IA family hydrolase [Paenibacillus xylanilyticus]NUU76690.1 HAD-IA family hydrolase [Paenibacillus xylanilyticus]
MENKPQLVLDLAGVLITNLSKSFWQELAIHAGTTFPILIEQLSGIRRDLWTGKWKEEQFWIWLQAQYPSVEKIYAYDLLKRTTETLPALDYLERWSQHADIHLLSNHCHEWVEPTLLTIQKYTKSITISNQVGFCKPNREIYELVQSHMGLNTRILYVDDQIKNLKPAADLGWETLLADEHHHWIEKVDHILTARASI